jgi:AraC family transcriptional regulator of adaptative response / DNA-3-methyladenine glycosylase II
MIQLDPDICDRAPKARDTWSVATAGVTVRLRYRSPYDWPAILSYLQARAIEGIERVQNECYTRTTVEHGQVGTVEVRHVAEAESLSATIRFPRVTALPGLVARIRRVFDLDADVSAIGLNLARDPLLAPLVAERPGLRAPGGWDGFELAVRAILGQQVSVEAGRRLVAQLVALTASADQTVLRTFPLASQVTAANLGSMKMPNARKQTLVELAKAALANPRLFQPLGTIEETVAQLRAIRGIGDWTAHYIALRAAREPDAFPATDVALLRSVAKRTTRLSATQLLERAERWRPWRAYAAQHLWAADAAARTAKQGEI